LAPSGFWLFPLVKKHPKGIHFTCDEEVEGAVRKWFPEQSERILQRQGGKKVISVGSNESNKKETTWKHQLWEQSALA
jgi:hypothetical protein